jgi:hypothetical protein
MFGSPYAVPLNPISPGVSLPPHRCVSSLATRHSPLPLESTLTSQLRVSPEISRNRPPTSPLESTPAALTQVNALEAILAKKGGRGAIQWYDSMPETLGQFRPEGSLLFLQLSAVDCQPSSTTANAASSAHSSGAPWPRPSAAPPAGWPSTRNTTSPDGPRHRSASIAGYASALPLAGSWSPGPAAGTAPRISGTPISAGKCSKPQQNQCGKDRGALA